MLAASRLCCWCVCPGFVLAPLLIMGFAIHWQWFPVALWAIALACHPAHARIWACIFQAA